MQQPEISIHPLIGRLRLTKMWELLSPLNGAMFLSVQNANHFGQLNGDTETLQNKDS